MTKGQKVSVRITYVEVARSIRHVFRPAHDFNTIAAHLLTQGVRVLDIDVSGPVLVCGDGAIVTRSIQGALSEEK